MTAEAVQHDPVVNPSIHYLGVEGATTQLEHADCITQNARIMAERSDIYGDQGAYNFQLCNSHGIRFEGRGWDRSSAANGQGDYTGIDYNPGSRAMCLLVGTDDVITDQCVAGIRDFANEAVDQHGMQWPLRSHSEFVATSCCGDPARDAVAQVNADHAGTTPTPKLKQEEPVYSLVTAAGATAWYMVWMFGGDRYKRPIATVRQAVVDTELGFAHVDAVNGFGIPTPHVIDLAELNAIPTH